MKLSHIAKAVNTDKGQMEVLTHFLYVEREVININQIASIKFSNPQEATITTSDGIFHYVKTPKEIDLLKKFFQYED